MAEKATTEDRGAVRILTINRPDQRNCVDGETAVGLGRAIEAFAAETIASYPNFPGICADRRAVLEGLSLDVDEGIVLEAKVVRPEMLLGRDASRAPTIRRRRARRLAAAASAAAELRTYRTEENQRWKRRHGCSTTRR
jgi:hypothetical protein